MKTKVVSLFSGGGGLDLGFVAEGYDIIWAIDNNPNTVATYKQNIGNHIICDDINKIDIETIPHADVVIGGPPCQSFSLAGKRNVEDERGQLVWRYIRIIKQVKPKAFVFENVTGLLSAKNSNGEKIIELLKTAFKEIGYNVTQQVMNAADYGIPQIRKRVILVGLKNGEFVFPKPTHSKDGLKLKKYVSVEEALGDLPPASFDEKGVVRFLNTPSTAYQKSMRRGEIVSEHFFPQMSELDRYIVKHVKPGGNYMDIPSEVNSERIRRLQRDGGHTTCYGRMDPSKPSYTINTYFNRPNVGCNIHYKEDRLITVREALRLQSFPDDYKIVSTSKQGRNLIVGNAVPPLLAKVIASGLKEHLKETNAMWISYSDSEVNSFHPVCERALNYALKLKGLDKDYVAKHHQTTGSLEMDYVIQNTNTGKYLCVVEVKRTPADVHSARYQFQAMSYVQMNAGQNEKPFYILTNLEYAFSFRYDSTRPRVFQQMLKPGLTHVGDFSSYTERDFIEKLGDFFAQQIDNFLNDRYDYLVTLEDFANHMEAIKLNDKRWKTHLAVLLYEYIRGAFNAVSRNELKDIRLFRSDVKRICDDAVRVNFKDIFTYSNSNFENTFSINRFMLSDIYNFGEQNINGNTIAGILHSIISSGHEHEGEVPTDLELARIVALLTKHSSNNLKNGDIVCDPAAGSGNLINEVIPEFNLEPTQILVNDVNSKLLELLSMRIGLNYPKIISKKNSPQIYNRDIADMDKSIFNDVKVVVMNPPFCAGINSIPRRNKIYTKIKKLTGNKPYTDVGQMPLEAVFLEMILALVKDGTTIACIFPKTHLIGRGPESQVIRKLLLNSFGLHTVFTYPGEDIFDDVTMDTCVLVGHAHTRSDEIKVISSYDRIPDIDTHLFYKSLSQSMTASFSQITPGIVGKCVSFDELRDSIDDGWRTLNSEMVEAITFVEGKIKLNTKIKSLEDCGFSIKRGGAGNSGGSDLVFIDSRDDFKPLLGHLTINTASGMRNAVLDTIDIGRGDSEFFDTSLNDNNTVDETIRIYNGLPARNGRQQRNTKTNDEWKRILKRESNGRFSANSVLIPRGIRVVGKVYFSKNPVFVSTNFVVCSLPSYEDAIFMASWMSTIFYQLVCEVSSKDQEGMRKMEVADILKTYIPDKDLVTQNTIDKIKNEIDNIDFIELKTPVIREVDKIWAEELFGADCRDILEEANRLLSYLTNKRN